jgi:branched-chain amino acid transport system ATP-binding protein
MRSWRLKPVSSSIATTETGQGGVEGAALTLEAVERHFGGVAAVDRVSLAVAPGARHGIIGPNGAGKTTLFTLISGEMPVTAGRISLFNSDITSMSPARRVGLGLGRTYQITRTFAQLTVQENLTLAVFGLRSSKFSMLKPWTRYPEQVAIVNDLANEFELSHRRETLAADLSHGELRQLDVALALALRPRVLLLDEPGAGLSPRERVMMRRLLQQLPADLTMVIIEHDMELISQVVERMTVLHLGRVVAEGTTAAIQADEGVREIYLGGRGNRNAGGE